MCLSSPGLSVVTSPPRLSTDTTVGSVPVTTSSSCAVTPAEKQDAECHLVKFTEETANVLVDIDVIYNQSIAHIDPKTS